MRQITLLILLLLLVPTVLAREANEPHEDKSCAVEEAGAEDARSCSFPLAEQATLRERLIAGFRPGYEADTAGWWTAGVLSLIVLVIAVWRWSTLGKKQRKPVFWAKVAGGIAIACVATFILYSAYVYWYNDISVQGLTVCDEQGCRISMHWHAELESMSVCSQAVERPWETGDLSGPHTHKDNRIHLHTILAVDPQSKQILETYPLTLGAFFDSIEWKYNQTCFKDTCDACEGQPATTKVWVNGERLENIRDYIWKDGDKVRVEFG
jgi:hypothetical protein